MKKHYFQSFLTIYNQIPTSFLEEIKTATHFPTPPYKASEFQKSETSFQIPAKPYS